MLLKCDLLGRFVDDLYQVETVSARFHVYQTYIIRLGFDGATYTFFPSALLQINYSFSPVFLHTEDYPVSFLDHYEKARFQECDFTIRLGNTTNVPAVMDWREHELNGLVSDSESLVIQVAREDYGIRNALTIPTLNPKAGIGGMSIISTEKDRNFQILKHENLPTLMRCTQLFHDISFCNSRNAIIFLEPFLRTLKPKDIQVLKHLASGQPLKTIDKGISYRYAANRLDDLRARMGGISKDKLMYIIGQLHLLDLL